MALLVLAGGLANADGALQYNVIDLGTLGGDQSYAYGINNSGQIVGYAYTTGDAAYHAAFWANSSSSPINLGTLGGNQSYANAINNSGQIVGYEENDLTNGFYYLASSWANSNSPPVDLRTPAIDENFALGINDSGNIVGQIPYHAAFWANSSSFPIDLGTLGGNFSVAQSINNSGQIVGYADTAGDTPNHAAYWANSGSSPIDLGTLGGSFSVAQSINNSGRIVGYAYTTGNAVAHAAYWANSSSSPIDLGTLGGYNSIAYGINNSGQIVGYTGDADGNPIRALLWTNSISPPIDLNNLLPANSGWTLQAASAINDSGEIVGYGINSNGFSHAFALVTGGEVVVTGKVSCACDSNAIAGASVQIGTNSATSDGSGSYSISNVPPGTYFATVSASNYFTLTDSVTIPSGVTVVTNNFSLTNMTFVINAHFDSTITSDPNAFTITNSIKSAIQVYEQNIANPICVTILFSTTNDPSVLGVSRAAYSDVSYAQYHADLLANPNKSANDTTAIATMPGGPGTGINGNTQVILLTAANLLAIGEPGLAAAAVAGGNGGGYDGEIYLNLMDLATLQSAAAHEIDEVLGIGGWGSSLSWVAMQNSQDGTVAPLDLFRYSATGVRSFTTISNTNAYFSINGGTNNLVYFNQDGSGDFGDWGDGRIPADGLSNTPPQVQDAFGGGNPSMGANEFIALDVVGYTLVAAAPRIQNVTYAAHTFAFGWTALPGQSYQVQYTTDLSGNVWSNLGGSITASNLTAGITDTNAVGPKRFYRVAASSPPVVPSISMNQPQAIVTPYSPNTNTLTTHYLLRRRP
jgi:probable HAF family extracellular repeat protein